jgi:hypothetical protein
MHNLKFIILNTTEIVDNGQQNNFIIKKRISSGLRPPMT